MHSERNFSYNTRFLYTIRRTAVARRPLDRTGVALRQIGTVVEVGDQRITLGEKARLDLDLNRIAANTGARADLAQVKVGATLLRLHAIKCVSQILLFEIAEMTAPLGAHAVVPALLKTVKLEQHVVESAIMHNQRW